MQLSVIILNYNVRYFLEQCIHSVKKAISGLDAEIIVVDNNSIDDSSTMMATVFPDLTYIQNQENIGFPKGNNIGVAQANGKYICILNPDTVVGESTFETLLRFAAKQKSLGIVGGQLVDGKGQFLPESKRGVPTPWVSLSKAIGLHKLAPRSTVLNGYYYPQLSKEQSGEVPILVGAFMFMKKKVYLELGGFDERYFMYVEDTDLSYRCLQLGYKNYYLQEVVVIHYKGESTHKDALYMKRFREGMQIFYKTHFSKSYVFDLLMRIGTFYFMSLKKNDKGKVQKQAEKVVLVSDNAVLHNWMHANWSLKPDQVASLIELQQYLKKNTEKSIEVILDGDMLSNESMIWFMKSHTHAKISFKIKPFQCDFIIGSNSSNDRGTVVKIEGQNLKKDCYKSEILLNL